MRLVLYRAHLTGTISCNVLLVVIAGIHVLLVYIVDPLIIKFCSREFTILGTRGLIYIPFAFAKFLVTDTRSHSSNNVSRTVQNDSPYFGPLQ